VDPYAKGCNRTLSIANIGEVASNSLTASALNDGFFLQRLRGLSLGEFGGEEINGLSLRNLSVALHLRSCNPVSRFARHGKISFACRCRNGRNFVAAQSRFALLSGKPDENHDSGFGFRTG
jgi:hypothetical protein